MTDPAAAKDHWESQSLPFQIGSLETLIAEVPAKVAAIDEKIQKLKSIERWRVDLKALIPQLEAKWNGLKAQQVKILNVENQLQLSQKGAERFLSQRDIELEPNDLDEVYAKLVEQLKGFLLADPKERAEIREQLSPLVTPALLERIGKSEPRRWGVIRMVEKQPRLLSNKYVEGLANLCHEQAIGAELFGEYLMICSEQEALSGKVAPVLKGVGGGLTVAKLAQEKADVEAQKVKWQERLQALRNPPPNDPPPPPTTDGAEPPSAATCSKTKLAVALSVVVALALVTYLVLRSRSSVATP